MIHDKSSDPVIVKAVEDARDTIVNCWAEWEAFAGQEAQKSQDNDAYFDAINAQLEAVLYGMLDEVMPRERATT